MYGGVIARATIGRTGEAKTLHVPHFPLGDELCPMSFARHDGRTEHMCVSALPTTALAVMTGSYDANRAINRFKPGHQYLQDAATKTVTYTCTELGRELGVFLAASMACCVSAANFLSIFANSARVFLTT